MQWLNTYTVSIHIDICYINPVILSATSYSTINIRLRSGLLPITFAHILCLHHDHGGGNLRTLRKWVLQDNLARYRRPAGCCLFRYCRCPIHIKRFCTRTWLDSLLFTSSYMSENMILNFRDVFFQGSPLINKEPDSRKYKEKEQ